MKRTFLVTIVFIQHRQQHQAAEFIAVIRPWTELLLFY
jgi:hypothetical protein